MNVNYDTESSAPLPGLADWLTLLPDAAAVLRADGGLVECNASFARLVGEQGTLAASIRDLVNGSTTNFDRALNQAVQSKQLIAARISLRTETGIRELAVEAGRLTPDHVEAPPLVLFRVQPCSAGAGDTELLGRKVEQLSEEVVLRRRAEAALREQREWFRATLSSIGDGVIRTDRDQRITYMNPRAEAMTGWSVDEARGQHISNVFRAVHETTGAAVDDPLAQVLRTGESVKLASHSVLIGRDGVRRAIEDTAAPVHDGDGQLCGIVLVFHDVTDRRKAEQTLREQEEWFRTTLSSIGDAVIATDHRGHVVFMNRVAEELTGWTMEDARGVDSLKVFNIVNQDTRQPVESPVVRVIREGEVVGLANHTVLIARDGSECPIDDSGAPIFDREGRLTGVVLVFRGISERYRHEQELMRSHALLRAVIEGTDESIFVKDVEGRYLAINQRGAERLGCRPDEMIGRTNRELLAPENAGRLDEWDHRVMERGTSETHEEVIVDPDGTRRVLLTNKAPYKDDEGHILGVIGVSRDITERKTVENVLREQEERQRFILNAARVGTWEWLIDTNEVRWSENMEALHGMDPGSFDGKFESYFEMIHPDDRQSMMDTIAHVLETGDDYHIEYREQRPDGAISWIEGKGQLVYDEDGRPVRLVGICMEITERKQAEHALRESEQRFRTMAEAAPVLIWMSDAHGRRVYFNSRWLAFTGRTLDEEVGHGWNENIHPEDRDGCCHLYQQAVENREPFHAEYRLCHAEGEYRWVLDYGVPRFEPDGTFVGYIGSCVDINDRYEAEQQVRSINETLEHRVVDRTRKLRELSRQLARAEQQERRRLAQVLHDDLQQLLVAAGMRTELLARRIADHDEVSSLAQQIRDLIQQSIDSSRSLTQELSPPVLYDRGICATLPWLAQMMKQRHGLSVSLSVDENAEPRNEEMRVSLFLAARELLFNAVKHAHAEKAIMTMDRPSINHVRLTVEDRGRGFSVEQIEQSGQGSGFGLFTIRERAEFVGGRMSIDSAPGDGTRVEIVLPDERPLQEESTHAPVDLDPPPRSSPTPLEQSVIRILLADDHQIVREGIAGILSEHDDLRVIGEAADGQQAIELAHEHAPDIVIMDTTMPRLNGIEATRHIAGKLPHVAVIGLSMHDNPDMARAMIEAGARRVLVKDGPATELVSVIREVASQGEA